VISDEIYHRTGYDGAPTPSAASEPALGARTIVVDGVSKAYAMTGWRLGWGILPPALAARATALVAHSTSCVPPFVQHAGIAALGGPQESVDAMVAELRRDATCSSAGCARSPACAADRRGARSTPGPT
jgi:aspartate/methionine/tyrosine aminotransferase